MPSLPVSCSPKAIRPRGLHVSLRTRTLASHAYVKPNTPSTRPSSAPPASAAASSSSAHSAPSPSSTPSASSSSSSSSASASVAQDDEATTSSPDLSPEHRAVIDKIIRVDQAGELGANWIYRGQKWAMGIKSDKVTAKQVEDMWENERHHFSTLAHVSAQHRVRPTLLYPLWQAMAFGLGAGTGLMSKEAAMACTEAVETVIGEHYDDQLKSLQPLLTPTNGSSPHPSLPLLAKIIQEFRDDELEHLDTAVDEGAQKAPGHSLLSAIIGVGCKAAIKVCERV